MTAITSPELYKKFIYTYYRIGTTQYRQIDHSPMLSCVWICTLFDTNWRPIKDFFGEDAKVQAQQFCLDRVNN